MEGDRADGVHRERLNGHWHRYQPREDLVDHAAERARQQTELARGQPVGRELVGHARAAHGVLHELALSHAPLRDRIGRPGQHVARRVEHLHHCIERGARLFKVDPDLRAGVAYEREDVAVGGVVERHVPMNLEAEPAILVAGLLLGRLPAVGAGGEVRGQDTEVLGVVRGRVRVDPRGICLLGLGQDGDVAVVREWQEQQAPPIAGGRHRGRAVDVGVGHQPAERIDAGTGRVVPQRRQDDREAGLAHHLHGATDPVVDVEVLAGRREARLRPGEFHHQAGVRPAEKSHARGRVEVLDDDLILEHVDHVDVVPDALDGDLAAAHDHPGGRLAPDAVRQPVGADERPEVVVVAGGAVDPARAAAGVAPLHVRECVGVDADNRPQVRAEVVPHDDRLRPKHIHGRRVVAAPARAVRRGRPGCVVLHPAVGQPQVALMDLQRVEPVKAALDRGLAAAERQVGPVDARPGARVDDDAAPVADRQRADRAAHGVELVGHVAVGVERAAGSVAVVAQAREDHRLARGTFGDELRGTPLEFDPRALELDDHTRVERQPSRPTGLLHTADLDVATGAAVDHQVLLDHVHDVGALESRRDVEPIERRAKLRLDLDEQAVDGVVRQAVTPQLRSNAVASVLKAVGRGGDPGPGTEPDPVEEHRRPGALELYRRVGIQLRIDPHLAAPVADVGAGDRVDEGPPRRGIGILPQHEATPLPRLDGRPETVGVAADGVVAPGRERDLRAGVRAGRRHAEHLERGARPRHELRRTADIDVGGPQLEHGTAVDHDRDVGRHVEGGPVRERPTGEIGADLIRSGRGACDPDQPGRWLHSAQCGLDRLVGIGECAVTASCNRA